MNQTVPIFSLREKRVWVAGHEGMVGSALMRRLQHADCTLITATHRELDFTRQKEVEAWMEEERPQAVFLAAAKVGGIAANMSKPVDFLYDNLAIAANVIHTAASTGVEKLLFLGSSCIYPKFAKQPIMEGDLLTGSLEPTNEWYAIAKISGIKLCTAYRRQYGCDFISAMPTNLYGPHDNFDLNTSHVIPALIRKAHEARVNSDQLVIWGSGSRAAGFSTSTTQPTPSFTSCTTIQAKPRQRGRRGGYHNFAARLPNRQGGWLSRRHNHRRVKARWHPTQAARCIKAERPRVGTEN
jgi:nucleoside-diphosphate-sugar epimerase